MNGTIKLYGICIIYACRWHDKTVWYLYNICMQIIRWFPGVPSCNGRFNSALFVFIRDVEIQFNLIWITCSL